MHFSFFVCLPSSLIMHIFEGRHGGLHKFWDLSRWNRDPDLSVFNHYIKISEEEEYRFIDLNGTVLLLTNELRPPPYGFKFEEYPATRVRELIFDSMMNVLGKHLMNPEEENLIFFKSCENLLKSYSITEESQFARIKFVLDRHSDADRQLNVKFEHVDPNNMKVTWTSILNGQEKEILLNLSGPRLLCKQDAHFFEFCEILSRKIQYNLQHQVFDEIPEETVLFLKRIGNWPEAYKLLSEVSRFSREINERKRKFEEV